MTRVEPGQSKTADQGRKETVTSVQELETIE